MKSDMILDNMPCGIVKLKAESGFPVLYANHELKQLNGAGKRLEEIVEPQDYPELEKEILEHLGNSPTRFELEFRSPAEGGDSCWYLIRINYVPGGGEEVLYGIIIDISDRKKRQEELLIREEQYRLASRHSGCNISIYDVPSKTLCQPPDSAFSFPGPISFPPTPDFIIDNGIIHRESVQEFLDFYNSMESGVPEGKSIIRMKMKSGEYHWFSACYSLIYGQNREPLRSIISYQDITGQYEKELAYQKWMEYMNEQKKDCIGYYEYNLKYDLFEEILGELTSTLPEYARNTFSDIINYIAEHFIYEEDRENYLKVFNRNQLLYHYYHGNRSLQTEHRRLRPDGTAYWCLGLIQIVPDPYTDTIKAFILIKDIDEEKKEALTLQEMSKQDSLTGLLNRGTSVRAIRHILKNSQDHHILIMLDIDRFKQINDRYGHQFGDKALRTAAARLKSALRRDDVFGRLGGDEFIILLKDVSYSMDLYARLENLCSLIGSALEPEAHISGSIGTAAFPEDGTTFEALYEKADIALYHAKLHGRNQYAVYEPGMSMSEDMD